MRVELEPGEQVTVTFAHSDGEITVQFGDKAITVFTDLPDTSGRQGIIYSEQFGQGIPKD